MRLIIGTAALIVASFIPFYLRHGWHETVAFATQLLLVLALYAAPVVAIATIVAAVRWGRTLLAERTAPRQAVWLSPAEFVALRGSTTSQGGGSTR